MDAKTVLVIDDDQELAALVGEFLRREGFVVEWAATGRAGLERVTAGSPGIVLLDIMLPDLDGFEVLRQIRRGRDVPVIMLTARGEEVDRIVGLEMGADDYLPKPFNPRELSARIKAVLRRSASPPPGPGAGAAAPGGDQADAANSKEPRTLRFRELEIDLQGYRATLKTKPLELTAVEFALLRELALAAGRVLTRDMLLDRVQGRSPDVFDRSIDVHISHLRRKLRDDVRNPRFIKTLRSVGYQFVGGED
jgi:DNA-binding response OmpR family regulator